jgi:CRISPR-associated endonuclease Csn1
MNAKNKIPSATKADLQLAFDVGHSSIGWATLQKTGTRVDDINILGCGAVTYRADDCLASARRGYRRQRRHIRSTRQRIARMKILLNHLGVLTKEELNPEDNEGRPTPGCAWPWLLAAQVLQGKKSLSWPELWDVLRWYAHNRGYDGNRRWSAIEAEAQKEDSEKEANARTLMGKHNVKTMAETFCKELGVEVDGKKKSSMKRFKGLNAAFPRIEKRNGIAVAGVEWEVGKILQAHFGKLKGADATLEKALFSDWKAIPCPDLKLPKRFQGGLLFGQLVPRFDNRIISICPISGKKVPSRNCPEFLNFRWAMQLANVQVARFGEQKLSPLNAAERLALDKQMRQQGSMTADQFKKAVRAATNAIRDNLDTMLMHPDAKEALLLDPVQRLVQSDDLKPFWDLLPERLQKRLRGQWRRSKVFTLTEIRSQLEPLDGVSAFDIELQKQLDVRNTKGKKKDKQLTREELLQKHFPPKPLKLDGRAAFARHLLKKTYEEVLAGKHPKEEGGCLFLSEEIREKQLNREIAEQTNNHLVRHRLLILERLLGDIIKEYATDEKTRIGKITIEVNRDLRAMSGKTAKEKAQDLGQRIANHHAVTDKLEKAFAGQRFNGKPIRIGYGLIKMGRVAEDLGWTCPYTGQKFEPIDLVSRRVDKDHIVPRSARPSDSLDSLVITFSAINKWKGNRTAIQFVEQEQGKVVPDLPNLSVISLARYKQFIESLETYKGHDDDKRRKKRRKDLMLLPKYEEKEFVPRDLTQTSQLVRLGAQVLRRAFADYKEKPIIISLPGSVTGAVRKSWKVVGCLALANPQVLGENGEVKTKTEIRDITHLHHALDACVLGLASHFIPNNGRIWELIVKRNLREEEQKELTPLKVFGFNTDRRFQLLDLDDRLKEQIRQRLAEKRVVQHIPARMDGLRVEQNTWRVISIKDGDATIQQRIRQADGSRPLKQTEEKTTKLLGLEPGKLSVNKGVLVIPDNFGVALDPQPTIIPFHKVWTRLQDLKKANNGKMPRVLRNGQLIRFKEEEKQSIYRVFSIKNTARGIMLDFALPDQTARSRNNNRLSSFLKSGMEILRPSLTGIACPTTLSASTPPTVP